MADLHLVKNGNNGNEIQNSVVVSYNNSDLDFATTNTPVGDMVYNLMTYNYGAGNLNIVNPVSNIIASQPNIDPLFTEAELTEQLFDIDEVMGKMFLPQKLSPVLDKGDNQFVVDVPIDIVGNRRVYISGLVDIGPYELEVHQLHFTSEQIRSIFQDKIRIDYANQRFTPVAGDDIYEDLWDQFLLNPEYREEFSRESKVIIKMKTIESEFRISTDKFDLPLAEYEAYYDKGKKSIILSKTDNFFGNMINSIFDDGRYVFFFSEIDSKLFVYINPTYNKGRSGKTNVVNEVRSGGLSVVSK